VPAAIKGTYTCQRCGTVNPRSSGRGRPRTYCPSCSKIRHDEVRVRTRYVDWQVGWKHDQASLDVALAEDLTLADVTYDPSGGQRTSWPTNDTAERTHARVITQTLPYPNRPGLSLHLTYKQGRVVTADVESGKVRTVPTDGFHVRELPQ